MLFLDRALNVSSRVALYLLVCGFSDQDDDVRKYVIARKFEKKGKTVTKRPHIQRLITPIRLQRKRARAAAKKIQQAKAQRDASEYARYVRGALCVSGVLFWGVSWCSALRCFA